MHKIYPTGGDGGFTSAFGGERLSKSAALIEIYGHFDELNSFLGFAAESLRNSEESSVIYDEVVSIQRNLIVLVKMLNAQSNDLDSNNLEMQIKNLEKEIMSLSAAMPELTSFILPAGSESASRLHLARVVCRRTERVLVRAGEETSIFPGVLTYINRLSDWLFMAARSLSHPII